MIKPVKIANHLIGPAQACFIIAEAGVNHNGDLKTAMKLVEQAKACGADAVKFQTFCPETVITAKAPKSPYQLQTTEPCESQFEMLRKLQLSYDAFRQLSRHAEKIGIMFLSTPGDRRDADLLIDLGVPAIKLPSMDIVNYPFLTYVAHKGLPIIISAGMATLGEIERGLNTIWSSNNFNVVLLHCVTNYPVQYEDANLRNMDTLRQAFQVPVGFSDHTAGTAVPIAAVALGAVMIEKHFTLDCSMSGPDHAASLEPAQFAEMAGGIRQVEKALGTTAKKPAPIELENRKAMRRSIVAAYDIPKDITIASEMLAMKRPGTGLGAEFFDVIIGRKSRQAITKDTLLTLEMV